MSNSGSIYVYNNVGRLAALSIGSMATAGYTYDGLERLAIRTTANMTPSGTTQYVYDPAGHLLAESDGSGNTLTEYVWLDDMPLALVANVNTGPTLYFVHADHLDRPLRMTDGGENVVWDAVYNPFGDVNSITGSATNNLRFPGQYFLIEDGLHYNWYRHYDPTLGRYIQPDPLRDAMTNLSATANTGTDAADLSAPMPSIQIPDFGHSSALPKNPGADLGAELPEFHDGPSIYAYAQSSPIMNTDRKGLASSPFTPIPRSSNQLCYVIPICTLVPSMVQIMRPQNMTSCYYSCFGGGTKSFIIEGIGGCPGIALPD